MDILKAVSETALITLNARIIEAEKENPVIEDPDIKPKFLRLFRNFKFMSRTQWTIKAAIG